MMSDDESPKCAECRERKDDVMGREVGSHLHTLCADCADKRRRAPGQERASMPPEGPSILWGGVDE